LVTDNLKASGVRPDLYDPKLNRTYAELASHYGMLVDPARARKPKDKPRVERPIPYVRDSFFAGRDFASLAAMQQAAVTWSVQVAGRRSCRPLGGAQPFGNDSLIFRLTFPAVGGLPGHRAGCAGGAARRALRVGGLGDPEGRRRLPRQR
jgi:hypothetical protein